MASYTHTLNLTRAFLNKQNGRNFSSYIYFLPFSYLLFFCLDPLLLKLLIRPIIIENLKCYIKLIQIFVFLHKHNPIITFLGIKLFIQHTKIRIICMFFHIILDSCCIINRCIDRSFFKIVPYFCNVFIICDLVIL